MHRRTAFWSLAFGVCLAAFGAGRPAHAQDAGARSKDPYFAPKLTVGFGGEQDVELEIDITSSASVVDAADDLEPTFGVGIAYVHPLHAFFAVGAQLSVASWISSATTDDDQARDLYADLSAIPQLTVDLFRGLEAYASVPLGLTLDVPGDDRPRPDVGAALATRGHVGTGLGHHAGALLGARIALSAGFGLLVETGVLYHRFVQPIEFTRPPGSAVGPTGSRDMDISLLQGAFNAGVYF